MPLTDGQTATNVYIGHLGVAPSTQVGFIWYTKDFQFQSSIVLFHIWLSKSGPTLVSSTKPLAFKWGRETVWSNPPPIWHQTFPSTADMICERPLTSGSGNQFVSKTFSLFPQPIRSVKERETFSNWHFFIRQALLMMNISSLSFSPVGANKWPALLWNTMGIAWVKKSSCWSW